MLIVVLITKFLLGAWIAIAAMAVIYVLMLAIRRHYDRVAAELEPTEERRRRCPSRNHAIVLVSKLHLPTLRAVAYAQATRPDTLTAVTVNVDDKDTRAIQAEWERRELPVPLTVVDSPYREITRPIIDFVKTVRRETPARRGHRLHPRVRRRPLVGEPAAQPERAADQGPAAVRAGRHGDQRAVAARLEPAPQRRAGRAGSR